VAGRSGDLERIRRELVQVARRHVRPSEAEDIAQDAMLAFLQHRSPVTNPHAYLRAATDALAKRQAGLHSREREHVVAKDPLDLIAAEELARRRLHEPVAPDPLSNPAEETPPRYPFHSGRVSWSFLYAYSRRRARVISFEVEGAPEDVAEFCGAANAAWLFTEYRGRHHLNRFLLLLTYLTGRFRGKLDFFETPGAYYTGVLASRTVSGPDGDEYIPGGPPHRWNGAGKPPTPAIHSDESLARKFGYRGGTIAVSKLVRRFDRFRSALARSSNPRRLQNDQMWTGGLPKTLRPKP
jgi:hypothetical protein